MNRLMGLVLCVVTVASCKQSPAPDTSPLDAAAAVSASPRVLGTCCPETDAEIRALIQRYETTPERERSPELALLGYRTSSGIPDRQRIVVRSSVSWATLWRRIVGSHAPRPAMPPVDFTREMLIVVTMGTRPTGGHTIAIDSVVMRGDGLRVFVRERSPGPSCITTAALTAPVALARLERSFRPVRFTTREEVRDCF